MRKIPLAKLPPLAEFVGKLTEEPIVVTSNGKTVAAIVAVPNADAETISLSTNPKFLAIIERSRLRHEREGGISPDEMRRRLGLSAKARRPAARRRKSRS